MKVGRLISIAAAVTLLSFVGIHWWQVVTGRYAGLHKSAGRCVNKPRILRGFHKGLARSLLLFRRDTKLLHLPLNSRRRRQCVPLVLIVHDTEQFDVEKSCNTGSAFASRV